MDFRFRPMTAADARDVERWRYPAPYDVYDRRGNGSSLDPATAPGRYYAAENRDGLVGYFEYDREEGGLLRFDLSLRPELTGQGHGEAFVRAGLEFAREKWDPTSLEVDVAAFNERALTVYERLGFEEVERHGADGGDGGHEFVRLRREATPDVGAAASETSA